MKLGHEFALVMLGNYSSLVGTGALGGELL